MIIEEQDGNLAQRLNINAWLNDGISGYWLILHDVLVLIQVLREMWFQFAFPFPLTCNFPLKLYLLKLVSVLDAKKYGQAKATSERK